MQLVKLMDGIWRRAGMDMRTLTYGCLPTGIEKGALWTQYLYPTHAITGMIQMVEDSSPLLKVTGISGTLSRTVIVPWLQKHTNNPILYDKVLSWAFSSPTLTQHNHCRRSRIICIHVPLGV